jgi:hypothetical protein
MDAASMIAVDPGNALIPDSPGVFTVLVDPFREHTGASEVTLATDVEIEAEVPLDPLPYGSAPVTHTYIVRNPGPFHATALITCASVTGITGSLR